MSEQFDFDIRDDLAGYLDELSEAKNQVEQLKSQVRALESAIQTQNQGWKERYNKLLSDSTERINKTIKVLQIYHFDSAERGGQTGYKSAATLVLEELGVKK